MLVQPSQITDGLMREWKKPFRRRCLLASANPARHCCSCQFSYEGGGPSAYRRRRGREQQVPERGRTCCSLRRRRGWLL